MILRFIFIAIAAIQIYPATSYSIEPASNYFSEDGILYAAVAPNGKSLASVYSKNNTQNIYMVDLSTLQKRQIFSTAQYNQEDSAIVDLAWLDNRYIALQFKQFHQGIEDIIDTKSRERLIILDSSATQNSIRSVRTKGWLVHSLPTVPTSFLYAKSGVYSKLYTLNVESLAEDKVKLGKLDRVDGGQFKPSNELRSIAGYAIRWFLTESGTPQAVIAFSEDASVTLTTFSESGGDETFQILKGDKDKKRKKQPNNEKSEPLLVPYALANGYATFYCLDSNEEERRSIYKRNYKTGQQEKIYETPSFKILSIITDKNRELIGVKALRNGTVVREYLGNLHFSNNPDSEQKNIIFSSSQDGSVALYYVESHNEPGRVELRNKNQKRIILDSIYPKLPKKLNTKLIRGSIINEGLNIPYLLTLPAQNTSAHPLVVLPHGGPIGVHDTPYFDNTAQFLAAQGYAVLRINYRGSSGHDKQLYEAGKKQWGNLILDDILKTTLEVALRPDVDGSSICLMGFSYGAYATAALLTQNPETYRCGVAVSGVYDVNLHINFESRSDERNQWIYDNIGNPADEYDLLKSISPLYQANQLQRPLMLAHGVKDSVTSVEQAYRYEFILNKYNKPHLFYIDDELGHSFDDAARATKLMDRAAEFLSKHIQN